jgi:two-component system, NarL family, nitrate/nitrite response regulator NarL
MISQTSHSRLPHQPQPTAAAQQRVRVLIADHDGLARGMIRAALADEDKLEIVLAASDGREALDLVRYYRPTVAIVETALPPDGGLELVRNLSQIVPETRVLTISVDDHQTALDALRAGAIGHITKDTEPQDLARQIIRAAEGEAIIPQPLLMPILQLLREIPHGGWRPLHSRLTTREWQIVELLDHGASTDQIADQLVLSPTTVYSHIQSLLRKLGVHNRHDAITAARHLRQTEVLRKKTHTQD